MIFNCENCGSPVERTLSEYSRSKHHFCSKRCGGIKKIGLELSQDVKEKISQKHLGKKLSAEHKKKISDALVGNPKLAYWSGKKKPIEAVLKTALANIGNKHCVGKKLSYETRKKISDANSREKSYLWRGGITDENKKIRNSFEYRNWRNSVFERDNYTCVICKKRGGDLQADHIKPFSLFKELRLDVNNGRTLCVECHKNTPTYSMKVQNAHKYFEASQT